ncbi:GntR family transcriptional regulator [Paenarthrobacter sp. NPDC089322]|uniref:FadR/GntR family transcriptional regulator n=1 Tax=Paenarthrobacter sp. NPDC089322 TaxID=3155065 RepID=UPI0034348799
MNGNETAKAPTMDRIGRIATMADEALILIVDDLRAGVYDVGSKLPALRDLATELGVGHTNVRAAIDRLEAAGVVQVNRGRNGGITVLSLGRVPEALESLYDPIPKSDLPYLVEAWTTLEREILVLASRRASGEDLHRLALKVDRLHAHPEESTMEFAERTVHVHILAATITKNRFLKRQFSHLLNLLSFVFAHDGYLEEFTPRRRAQTLDHYDRLLSAVTARNEERIAEVVRERHQLQMEMMFGPAGTNPNYDLQPKEGLVETTSAQ